MKKEASKILDEQVSKIKPSEEEIEKILEETGKIIKEIEKNIKKRKMKASIFIGGSLAKGTLIRKKNYDIDIFVRFDKKYKNEEISNFLEKLLKGIKIERIHGSRDYFQAYRKNLLFEIIPVAKIARPEEARNITDLSYFHVNYILNKTKKNKNLAGEIMLAKSFCHAQKAYGAESYIKGFSGYALELLVSYYKSFVNFIKAVSKSKEKIVIDPARFYKNKQDILNNLNDSKLQSAIVLVDPTFKERNAIAALSAETFEKFREACKSFLKHPSAKFFEEKIIEEKKFNLIIEMTTNKQEGDIAGSKLLKFSRFIEGKIKRDFEIKSRDFNYDGGKKAKFYLNIRKKGKIVLQGPPINKPERLLAFKNAHKRVFLKNHIAWAAEKPKSLKDVFNSLVREKQVMKDMGITGLKIIKR